MQAFATLYETLDQTKKHELVVEALVAYFNQAIAEDKIWALALLINKRPQRAEKNDQLKAWALEMAAIPNWLLDASHQLVGDTIETVTLVLPPSEKREALSLSHYLKLIQSWKNKAIEERSEEIKIAWAQMDQRERFLFNKLLSGSFRIEVNVKLIAEALSHCTGKHEKHLQQRILSLWDPNKISFQDLIYSENPADQWCMPYPFFKAKYIDTELPEVIAPESWYAEHRWAGLRVQIIIRENQLYIWSKDEELITHKFPECENLADLSNGAIIDGELLAFKDEQPMPINVLQTRLGRKKVTKKTMDEIPIVIMAYDLLEQDGKDIREESLEKRRAGLTQIVESFGRKEILRLSPLLTYANVEELAGLKKQARTKKVQGLVLKKKSSNYLLNKKSEPWLKWKVDPLTIKAVLLYAEVGENRRANLYTNYTFALWQDEQLIPIGKADAGLSDHLFMEISLFVQKNTIERFGPVRSVKPELVFELSFAGLTRSARRKSGILLDQPKILRWLKDSPTSSADSLSTIKSMLDEHGS